MDHRQRILAVVILTFVITLSVGFVTEYVRQSMVFSWAVEEGDTFDFDIVVRGYTATGTTVLPPPFVEMNNTRITAEIVSLPNVSIIFYSRPFLETVVFHMKTSSTFVNGTAIPYEFEYSINEHISQSILPIGGWSHLDSFFPNQIDRPIMQQESYLSAHLGNSFYFGYRLNESTEVHEWCCLLDLNTGIPQVVWFWNYREGQPWIHSYNVTMTLFT